MTGLLWVPYILDRIMVRGPIGAMANPGPKDKPQSAWAQRLMAAHINAVENLVVFAPLVLTARALGVGNLQTHLKFSLRAEELACAVYGNNATCSRPVVSRRPSMTFMFCTAWPEAPLVRLSSAETIMARPATRSAATPIKVMLEPRTCR